MDMHYHRLVGHVRADDPDARLRVFMMGPDLAPLEPVAGPGASLTVNHLEACCKGASTSPFVVVLANDGPREVAVTVRLHILHDGLAVANDDAETGALASLLLAPLVAAAILGWKLRRPVTSGADEARRALRRSARSYGLLWLAAAGLAGWGMLRYGGGPVVGTLAATADLPPTGNVIITTHGVLVLAFIALWIACLGGWTGAARRAGDAASRRGAILLGAAHASGVLVFCLAWALEYGVVLAPLLVGLASAALPVGGTAWLLLRGRQAQAADADGRADVGSLPPS